MEVVGRPLLYREEDIELVGGDAALTEDGGVRWLRFEEQVVNRL